MGKVQEGGRCPTEATISLEELQTPTASTRALAEELTVTVLRTFLPHSLHEA